MGENGRLRVQPLSAAGANCVNCGRPLLKAGTEKQGFCGNDTA